MSIASTTSRVSYTLSAADQLLTVPFYFLEASHLKVVKKGSPNVTLALTTNYTVNGAGSQGGGSIKLTGVGTIVSDVITILRNVPATQTVDYVFNDRFPAELHEKALDKLTMIVQQQGETQGRSLRFEEGENIDGTLPLASRASKVLAFDANGIPTYITAGGVILDTGAFLTPPTMADLAATPVTELTAGRQVLVAGFYAPGDGGGGPFRLSNTSDTAVAGMVVNSPTAGWQWKRVVNTPLDDPRWFGAKMDGVTDDRAAFVACAANRGAVLIPPGTTYWSAGIQFNYTASTNSFTMVGCGMGKSRILCNDTNTAFSQIEFQGNSSNKNNVTLRDFSIGRATPTNYVGTVGPKTVFVANGKDVVIENVEEYGAIGFGVQVDYCTGAVIRGCYVHDHKNGETPSSGYDGIHVYRSTDVIVESCRVERVGDDGISAGSFTDSFPVIGLIARGNYTTDTGAGGINLYGFSRDCIIDANIIKGAYAGGVKLWDPYDSVAYSIRDVTISNNRIYESGLSGSSAGIYLGQTTGTGTGFFEDIDIIGNHCTDCGRGISVVSAVSNKGSKRVRLLHNRVKGSSQWGIWLNYCSEYFEIRGNRIEDVGDQGIYCYNSAALTECVIKDNTIKNYNSNNSGNGHGIWARSTGYSIVWVVTGNIVFDPVIAATTLASSSSQAYEMTDTSSPLSIFDVQVRATLKDGGAQFPVAGGQGEFFKAASAPATGTWRQGTHVWNSNAASGAAAGWVCTTGGTLRTISGVTADTSSGSNVVTLIGGFAYAGEYITIAGVTGTLRVREVDLDTGVAELTSNCDATVVGAAVASSAPVFKAMANLA